MKKFFLLISVLTAITFGIGFVAGVKKFFPYNVAKSFQRYINDAVQTDELEECEIETLSKLPNKFSVIVGHAYGSPKTSALGNLIAPVVQDFIQSNLKNIESIIFTGDVFSVPSSIKWASLYKAFGSVNIYIAPGNHDIRREDSKEIFQRQDFIKKEYPFQINTNGTTIIVEDSVSNNWSIDLRLKTLLEMQDSDVLVARHNIVVSELIRLANSIDGASKLPTASELARSINTSADHKITWVMGDGGAFSNLPRITCKQFKNHRFIVNGIGEISGDTVLIVSMGNIYQYPIH